MLDGCPMGLVIAVYELAGSDMADIDARIGGCGHKAMLAETLINLLVPDVQRLLEPVEALQQEAHLVGVLG